MGETGLVFFDGLSPPVQEKNNADLFHNRPTENYGISLTKDINKFDPDNTTSVSADLQKLTLYSDNDIETNATSCGGEQSIELQPSQQDELFHTGDDTFQRQGACPVPGCQCHSACAMDGNDDVDGATVQEATLKDRDIDVHHKSKIRNCSLEHAKSGKFLCQNEREIQLAELQNHDNRYVLQSKMAGGTECRKDSWFYSQPVQVVCLNDIIGDKDYMVPTATGSVGVKKLKRMQSNLQVIPTDNDPRYYYLIYTSGTTLCLMSTKYEYHCLASDGMKIYLKKMPDQRSLQHDAEIQFRIHYRNNHI